MAIQIYVIDLERMFPAIVAGNQKVLDCLVDCFKTYPHCISNLITFSQQNMNNDKYNAVIEIMANKLFLPIKETV